MDSLYAPFGTRYKMQKRSLSLLFLLLLNGCYGNNTNYQEALDKNIALGASPGMHFIPALQKLSKMGFTCQSHLNSGVIECERNHYYFPLISCVEHVYIKTDPQKNIITDVSSKAACLGGFG